MTRKDYVLIARALNRAYTDLSIETDSGMAHAVMLAAKHVGADLAYENPAFDLARFLRVVRGEQET
jgi:hypothetical protein